MLRSARRSSAGLAVLLAVGLLGGSAPGATAEAPVPAAAAAPDPMNVVLVLTDDQTVESLEKMPYLRSRDDWIEFDSAYAENPLCCPTRATVLQGRYDTRTGVHTNAQAALFDETETLPVWLQRAGYRTGLYGKYFNAYPWDRGHYVPAGWDDWNAAFGEQVYSQYDWNLNSNGMTRRYGTAPADHMLNVMTSRVEAFVRSDDARPFFAFVTPTVNHSPWIATPKRKDMFATATVPQPPSYDEADVSDKPAWVRALPRPRLPGVVNQRRRSWAAAVSLDDSLRRIDAALATSGHLDDTVVIVVSDNGISLGEHRWLTKRCAYDECARVPMLVRYPGQRGRVVPTPVSTVDVASTVLGIADAQPGLPQDGRSLLPVLQDPTAAPARDEVLMHWPGGDSNGASGMAGSLPQFWAVVTPRWKYVELDTGERELYDRVQDPYELRNRASARALATTRKELAAQLARLKNEAGVVAGGPRRTDVPSGAPLPTVDPD